MKHDWIRREWDSKRVCTRCNLYDWYDVRNSECKGQYVDVDNQRTEPNEEVLRQLGHGLK